MASRAPTARLKRAKELLSDPYGIWCAWCLDYIERPEDLEMHHLLAPRHEIEECFGVEPWVVPVHRHPEVCHRKGLQSYADTAGRALLDARDPTQLELRCSFLFYDGNLPACLLLRKWAWDSSEDPSVGRQHALFTLVAAAGCNRGLEFVQHAMSTPERIHLRLDPDIRLYLAAAQANAGNIEPTAGLCAELDATRPGVRAASSAAFSKLSRMRATIHPNVKIASEAVAIARDSADPSYQSRTALLTLAAAYEAKRGHARAVDVAEELNRDSHVNRPSWWHEIQTQLLFARGYFRAQATHERSEQQREAMRSLIRAQYASAMLDFVGLPIPDFRSGGDRGTVVKLTPTDHVHWFSTMAGYTRGAMVDLRKEAIFGGVSRGEGETRPLGFQAQIIDSLVERATRR